MKTLPIFLALVSIAPAATHAVFVNCCDASGNGVGLVTKTVPSLSPAGSFTAGKDIGGTAWAENAGRIFLPHVVDGVIEALDDQKFQPAGYIRFLPGNLCSYVVTGSGYAYAGVYSSGLGGTAYISQFDPATLQQKAMFELPAFGDGNVGGALGGVLSPDGTRFYAPYFYIAFNTGDVARSAMTQGNTDPQSGLAVFDTGSATLLDVFPQKSFATPVIAPSGTVGYVPVVNADYSVGIDKIDLSTGAAVQSVILGRGTANQTPPLAGPLLSPDGLYLYAVVKNDVLLVLDANTLGIVRLATIPDVAGTLSLSPDGRFLYASLSGQISVIDVVSLEVLSSVSAGADYNLSPALFIKD